MAAKAPRSVDAYIAMQPEDVQPVLTAVRKAYQRTGWRKGPPPPVELIVRIAKIRASEDAANE